jgi:tRNA dimethylallyltransferase
MQVYRSLDIITSKATVEQKKAIKHHLLSIINPTREYNVAKYRKQAILICDKLFKKGKIPLFVGGTGLYYSIIVDGLFPAVPEDKKIRLKLYKLLASQGSNYLHKRLAKVDPVSGLKIHAHDAKRIIRALEVFMLTGKPISHLQKQRVGLGPEYEVKVFGLNLDRQALYSKIDQRVEKMFKLGLIPEVQKLLKRKLSQTASYAIGLRELQGYFKQEYSLAEAKRLIKRNSRHYAKRQLTWFKHDQRIQWIKINKTNTPAQIALNLWKKLS